MSLAQGHNAVTPERLDPAAPRSRVKRSTTEQLCSLFHEAIDFYKYFENYVTVYLRQMHVLLLQIFVFGF